jgi:hypothetical protein
MSFIARELDRIASRLRESNLSTEQYERLYAAQQALSWVLEPSGFATPYEMIVNPNRQACPMGIPAAQEGYPA